MGDEQKFVSERIATKPDNDKLYELGWKAILEVHFKCTEVQLCGRNGQKQYGLDVIGNLNGNPNEEIGIQCKWKGEGKTLTVSEIDAEIAKLKTRPAGLPKKYYIVTTAPHDQNLQNHAAEIQKTLRDNGKDIAISVLGWSEQSDILNNHANLVSLFDSTSNPLARRSLEVSKKTLTQTNVIQNALTEVAQEIGELKSIHSAPSLGDGTTRLIDSTVSDISKKRHQAPQETYAELLKLYKQLQNEAPVNALARIKINMGLCKIDLQETGFGADLILEGLEASNSPEYEAFRIIAERYKNGIKSALNLSESILQADPENIKAWSFRIQLLSSFKPNSPPLKIPTLISDEPEIKFAQTILYREKGDKRWITLAKSFLDLSDATHFMKAVAADALLEEVLDGSQNNIPSTSSEGAKDKLIKAKAVYAEVWTHSEAKTHGPSKEDICYFCNYLTVLIFLGENDVILTLCNSVIPLLGADADLLKRVMFATASLKDTVVWEKVKKIVEGDDCDLGVKLDYALLTKDIHSLANFSDENLELVSDFQKSFIVPLRDLCLIEVSSPSDAEDQIKAIAERHSENLKAVVMCIDCADRMELNSVRDSIYENASKHVLESLGEFSPGSMMLANIAYERSDFETVINCLYGNVSTEIPSTELRMLADSFQMNSYADERGISFFESLPEDIASQENIALAHAHFRSKSGDPSVAKGLFQYVWEQNKSATSALEYALALKQFGEDEASQAFVNSLEIRKLTGDPAAIISCARLMENCPETVEVAYDLAMENPHSYPVVQQYVAMTFIEPAMGGGMIDCNFTNDKEVHYKTKSGVVKCVFITSHENKTTHEQYLKPDHKVAKAFDNVSEGDVVQIEGFGEPQNVEVVSVTSGPIALSRFHMQNMKTNFPENNDFFSIPVTEDDVEPLLEFIREGKRTHEELAKLYSEQRIPLSTIAGIGKTTATKFANQLRQSGNTVRSNLGTESNWEKMFAQLENIEKSEFVTDGFTAIELAELGILPALAKTCAKISMPQSEFDLITPDEMEKLTGIHANRVQTLDIISKYIKLSPVTVPAQKSVFCTEYVKLVGRNSLDVIFLASDDAILLTDDLHFSEFAAGQFDSNVVSSLAIVHRLAEVGSLDKETKLDCLIKMGEKNYDFLAILMTDLRDALTYGKDVEQFMSLSKDLLSIDNANLKHLGLVSGLFSGMFKTSTKRHNFIAACLGALITKIYHLHPSQASFMLTSIYEASNLVVREYIISWHLGHFIKFQLV